MTQDFTWYSANSIAIAFKVLSAGWSNLCVSWNPTNEMLLQPAIIWLKSAVAYKPEDNLCCWYRIINEKTKLTA